MKRALTCLGFAAVVVVVALLCLYLPEWFPAHAWAMERTVQALQTACLVGLLVIEIAKWIQVR